MAVGSAPNFPQTPKNYSTAIGNGTASAWVIYATAGASGSKIVSAIASNSDSSARVLQVATGQVTSGVTITIASPGVITFPAAHGLVAGDQILLSTTGALPTGLTAGTTYFVLSSGLTSTQIQLATSAGGTAINTSGSQSGTHSATTLRIKGSISVAAASGTDGATPSVNLLDPSKLVGLQVDADGQVYQLLQANNTLMISSTTTVAANKVVAVSGDGADF